MIEQNIAIYQSKDGNISVQAKFENDTIWLTQAQIGEVFQSSISNINEHITRIFEDEELIENEVIRKFRITASDGKNYNVKHYNLDMIISVGYRVKSKVATHFRRWATQTLKTYLVNGYAINEQRLIEQRNQLEALKTAIDLVERGIANQIEDISQIKQLTTFLQKFSKGLEMLDDYDHERLDSIGRSKTKTDIISPAEFLKVVEEMKPAFTSDVFGVPKDDSFESSVRQIYQTFGGVDCYETLETRIMD